MSALNYAPFEIKSQSSSFLLLHGSGSLQLISPLRANTAVHRKRPLFLFLLKTIIHLSSRRMSRAESLPFPFCKYLQNVNSHIITRRAHSKGKQKRYAELSKILQKLPSFFPHCYYYLLFPFSQLCWL